MPINFFNVPIQEPDYSGLENFLPTVLQHAQAPEDLKNKREMMKSALQEAKIKPKMAQENLLSKELQNMITRKYSGKEKEARLALLNAQASHQRKMTEGEHIGGLSDIGKTIRDLKNLEASEGKDSEMYKLAQSMIDKKISGGEKGLKLPGSVIKTQLSAKQGDAARRHIDENYMMPKRFTGPLASKNLAEDFASLAFLPTGDKRNKVAHELVMAVVADKIAPDYAFYQLQSQKVTPHVHAIEAQERANRKNWPVIGEDILNNMPEDVEELIRKMHSNAISKLGNITDEVYEEFENKYTNKKGERKEKEKEINYRNMSDEELDRLEREELAKLEKMR